MMPVISTSWVVVDALPPPQRSESMAASMVCCTAGFSKLRFSVEKEDEVLSEVEAAPLVLKVMVIKQGKASLPPLPPPDAI